MRITPITMTTIAAVFAIGCYSRANVQCETNSNCNLFGAGVCTMAGTGNHWCAYPDSNCPSGYRYSDQDVGDGVSNACVGELPSGSDGGATDASVSDGATSDIGAIDGSVQAPYGSVAIRVGGNQTSGGDVPIRVASAGSAIAVVGILNQSADLGGGMRIGSFVVKYNSDGLHVWSKSWDISIVTFLDVEADDSGDIIVAGSVRGAADMGCGSFTANSQGEFLLAKFSGSDGACKWSIHAGNGDSAEGVNIAVIGSDLLVTGNLGGRTGTGTLTLGTSVLTSGGLADIFVARFQGANGQAIWATSFPGTRNDYVSDIIVIDPSSFAIAGFFFGGTLTIGTTAMTSQAFVTRLKSDGTGPIWVQQYNSGAVGDPHGLAALPSGDLMLATNFRSSINFGNFTLTGAGSALAVVKLDGATGTATAGKAYGNSTYVRARGLVALPNGNIAGAAEFQGQVLFGDTTLVAGAGQALAAFQLSTDGTALSAKRYGGGNELDFVTSVRRCESNEVVLTGTFDRTIDFGAGAPLSTAGSRTIFAARVAP